jgi:hypothetical protein
MSEAKMPKRWSIDYDGYMEERDEGDYVEAKDVEPLVAEIERLRSRVEELEQKRISASDAFRMVMALWGAGFREGELGCRPSVSDATLKKINDRSERCKSAIISALTWEAKP